MISAGSVSSSRDQICCYGQCCNTSLICSLGVFVKNYETVITTDNLLSVGFTDLSLCPVKQSVVGSVITRNVGYLDNIPDSRFSDQAAYSHHSSQARCEMLTLALHSGVPCLWTPSAVDTSTGSSVWHVCLSRLQQMHWPAGHLHHTGSLAQ